jgi:ABC-type glycerol-3-phosphate transport system substrate-binding protein
VWLPDALIPSGNVTATTVLNQQIAAFVAAQPDVHVQTLVKRARGPGGILDLMQTAVPVAPSVLPDVTLLDLASVPLAAQAALLRPLNGLLPEETLTDMFPFAEVGHVDERWLAVAYAVDLEHIVYPATRVSSPPVTWTQVISGPLRYLFPAGATSGTSADALLAHYVAAGGRWLDANGQPALDVAALTQMLRQFKDAQQAGVIPAAVLNFNSPDDTWAAYLNMPTQMAHVRASRFITQRLVLTDTLTAASPGYAEPARLIARGWAFVVPARDPMRTPIAAALVRWLVSADNEGAWTKAANMIPARRSAFERWYPPDRYTAFLRRELERAISPPPGQVAQVIGPAIQKAMADVLRGLVEPAEAATTAAASVSRQP